MPARRRILSFSASLRPKNLSSTSIPPAISPSAAMLAFTPSSSPHAFLRKVQKQREDTRYEARGEDIMRLEFVRMRREEAEELARTAPSPSEEEEEEEYDLPGWSQMDVSSQAMPEDEVEEFVRDEEAEMQALLEYMPEEMETQQSDGSENLWSDGADYDALFSEVLLSQENAPPEQGMQRSDGGGEEMDMS